MTTDSARAANDGTASGMWAVGIGTFAGIMLVLVGGLEILQGAAAIAKDAVYVTGIDYIYELDVTAWGWIHLALGAIAVAVGIGILMGQTWGLVGGIAIAVLAILFNFAFIPYYPAWSLIVMGLNILVIWACCRQLAAPAPPSRTPGYGVPSYGHAPEPVPSSAYERPQTEPPHAG